MLKYSKHDHWLCFFLSCSLSLYFFHSLAVFTVHQPFLRTGTFFPLGSVQIITIWIPKEKLQPWSMCGGGGGGGNDPWCCCLSELHVWGCWHHWRVLRLTIGKQNCLRLMAQEDAEIKPFYLSLSKTDSQSNAVLQALGKVQIDFHHFLYISKSEKKWGMQFIDFCFIVMDDFLS